MVERVQASLADTPLDAAALLAGFLDHLPRTVGGVVSFLGLTRGAAANGDRLSALVLESHPVHSPRSVVRIAEETAERFSAEAVAVVHRIGAVPAGEPVVWVACAASHRRAAFEAAEYLMDRLKTEAVLWKREEGPGGSRWIEPTAADHTARERWK